MQEAVGILHIHQSSGPQLSSVASGPQGSVTAFPSRPGPRAGAQLLMTQAAHYFAAVDLKSEINWISNTQSSV